MASVKLNHIYKVYPNGVKAVNDFCLDINNREFIVFVGPSGCGKSTTLRMIAGLEDVSAGEVSIDDLIVNDIEPKDRDIAMVFQNYALYPHMTVYDNMAFGLRQRKMDKEEIHKRVVEAAEILNITDYLDRKPRAMSGGQRQRVALGRAIVREPKVFLLDEPLSNLDAKLRTQMRSEILKLYHKLKTTFVYVTHDQTEAMTMGTRIVVMKDGYIQQSDKPKMLYEYPNNKFVAGFIGTPQMNFFKTTLEKQENKIKINILEINSSIYVPYDKFVKIMPEYLDGKKEVWLGIRAENLSSKEEDIKNNPDATIKCKVSHIEELGNQALIYADLRDSSTVSESSSNIVIEAEPGTEIPEDTEITIAFNTDHIHFFDAENENNIMPRIPTINVLNGEIKNQKLIIASKEFALPKFVKEVNGKCKVTIPSEAVINGKVIVDEALVEEINNVKLTPIKLSDDTFLFTINEVSNNIDLDMRKVTIEKDNEVILKALPKLNSLKTKFVKKNVTIEYEKNGKTKNKKAIEFGFNIGNVYYPSLDHISEKLINYGGTKIFNKNLRFDFKPEEIVLHDDGKIQGKVLEFYEYAKDKYAKVDVNGEIIYLKTINDRVDLSFDLDLENISVVEADIDMKLI